MGIPDPPKECRIMAFRLHVGDLGYYFTYFWGSGMYYIDGVPTRLSVTSLIHALAELFVELDVIRSMKRSANWPRPGYLRSKVGTSYLAFLQGYYCADLPRLFCESPRNVMAICQVLQSLPISEVEHLNRPRTP